MVPEWRGLLHPILWGPPAARRPGISRFPDQPRPELKNFIRQGIASSESWRSGSGRSPRSDQTGLHGGGDLCLQLIRQDVYF